MVVEISTCSYQDIISEIAGRLTPRRAGGKSDPHAIEVALARNNIDVIRNFLAIRSRRKKGKPTNSEFIAMMPIGCA